MTRPLRKTRRASRGRARLAHLDRVSDAAIERTAPPELRNLPPDFWADPAVVFPVPKRAISLRLDEDVLAWFKAAGPRYQSRINAVLRSYMAHVRRRGGRKGAA